MNINELLNSISNKAKAEYGQRTANASAVNTNFESIFSKVDASNSKQGYTEKQSAGQTKDKRKTSVESNQANRKSGSNTSAKTTREAKDTSGRIKTSDTNNTDTDTNTNKAEKDKQDNDIVTAGKVADTSEEQNAETDVVDSTSAEIIKNLACILDMSEEQIAQILNALNISAVQLTDKDNMNQFMQVAFQVDSSVKLLNVPNINETFESVGKLMAQYDELAETVNMASDQRVSEPDNENAVEPVVQTSNHVPTVTPENRPLTNVTETNVGNDSEEILTEQPDKPEVVAPRTTANDSNMEQQSQQNDNLSNSSVDVEVVETTFDELAGNATASRDVQFNQVMTKSQATSNINSQDVVQQIIEKMKVDVRGNLTEVKITLTPEHLGDVTLKISTQNGIVTAHFVAENERVKEVIESNFNHLKDTLQQQGIELSSLSVSVGQNPQEQRMQEFLHNQQKSSRRIAQIINQTAIEDLNEMQDLKEADVYNNNVNYQA